MTVVSIQHLIVHVTRRRFLEGTLLSSVVHHQYTLSPSNKTSLLFELKLTLLSTWHCYCVI